MSNFTTKYASRAVHFYTVHDWVEYLFHFMCAPCGSQAGTPQMLMKTNVARTMSKSSDSSINDVSNDAVNDRRGDMAPVVSTPSENKSQKLSRKKKGQSCREDDVQEVLRRNGYGLVRDYVYYENNDYHYHH